MRTVWVEDLGNNEYAISTENHDGIVYKAESVEDAVAKYEADKDCKVGVVYYWEDISGHSERLSLTEL